MKRNDQIKEIRSWSAEDQIKNLRAAESELMGLRFKNASNQLKITSQLPQLRKKIARIKTVMSQVAKAE